ncbi:tryptophan--tRNA ligase [Gardnerella vaginalis 315-A]|nr:tryptophan--tRNA ligase [Gardnerella vaginalis 315-A]
MDFYDKSHIFRLKNRKKNRVRKELEMSEEAQVTAAGNEISASFVAAQKRSDATLEKLKANPSSFTMLTGDRPTGRLHLGHYFGSIRERVAMQNLGVNTNVIIADYQVITDRDTVEHVEDNVLNLVLDYMAAGIDPKKTMIFTHSAVPAENQLMLPFLSLVTEAELHRNPTVKAEMEASGHALTGLLLTYPVHQACDILFCKANVVPIGKDNLPHIEITRTIARRFNERYAKKNPVFPEPAAILSDTPEIPGLDGRKMSKSYGNSIMLGATAEDTAKLIKKSPTDSERTITFDPVARPQVSALLTTAGLVTGRDPKDIAQEIGDAGAGALKAYVIESVNNFLAPHRERRAELAKDMDAVRDILHDGNARAAAIAQETLDQVREAMNMKY